MQKYNSVTGGTIIAGALRTGAQGLRTTQNNQNGPSITLDAQGTWIVGKAIRVSALPVGDRLYCVATVDAGTVQGCFAINTDGTISVYRGGPLAGALVATSALALLPNVWYYVEFRHVIDNAAGTLEVRVDGAVWVTFAGDTQQTANATANAILLQTVTNGAGIFVTADHDDLYILDGTGAAPNNTYWGNTQIEALVPNGAGNYTEWTTLFGAATHWQAENEVPPDEDTSYVESATLNQRDLYTFGNLSVVSATINGIQILMRARTTLAGADNIARMIRHTATDNQGADVALQTSYNYIREILATDPIAAAAWSVANINAMEAGARVR